MLSCAIGKVPLGHIVFPKSKPAGNHNPLVMASANTAQLSRVAQLAAIITSSIAEIDEICFEQRLPPPSFAENTPPLPREASTAKDAALEAAAEITALLLDPLALIYQQHGVSLVLPSKLSIKRPNSRIM